MLADIVAYLIVDIENVIMPNLWGGIIVCTRLLRYTNARFFPLYKLLLNSLLDVLHLDACTIRSYYKISFKIYLTLRPARAD